MTETYKKSNSWTYRDFIQLIFFVFLYFAVLLIFRLLLPHIISSKDFFHAYDKWVFIVWEFFMMFLIYKIFFIKHNIKLSTFFKPANVIMVAGFIVIQVLIFLLKVAGRNGFSDLDYLFVQNGRFIWASSYLNWFISKSLWIFLTPIWEETLFRGIIQKYIERKVGVIVSIVLPSLLFGLMHFPAKSNDLAKDLIFIVGTIFVESCLKGFLVYKTKSLTIPISMHISNNILSATVEYLYSL